LIASGEIPAIISSSNYYMKLGLLSDLNDFIKKVKIDLNRFEPGVFDVL
jgi:multiple sugar transport system substrate-binding protein